MSQAHPSSIFCLASDSGGKTIHIMPIYVSNEQHLAFHFYAKPIATNRKRPLTAVDTESVSSLQAQRASDVGAEQTPYTQEQATG